MSPERRLEKVLASLRRRSHANQLAAAEQDLAEGRTYRAYETVHRLAQAGVIAAQYRLGQMYERAEGVVQSMADAVHWYRLAAERGDVASQSRLGLIFFTEPPAPSVVAGQDSNPAQPAATASAGTLAQLFPHGITVSQDFAESARWNLLASNAGVAEAQTRLAHQLALGLGVPQDLDEAERWFQAAADQNDPAGQLGMGILHAGGYGRAPQYEVAAHWLSQSAKAGNASAQYWLGTLHLRGLGVPLDLVAAYQHFQSAAEQDDMPAMYQLGLAHWRGEGTQPNLAHAESWLRRAAARGHSEAARALAHLLSERDNDDGVEVAGWLQQSIDRGNVAALCDLATMCRLGTGGQRPDSVQAARMYK